MAQFGLVGHPVSHSMSKIMHEAAYRSLGIKHRYDLFDVSEMELARFMSNADFQGLNITIPHKVSVMAHLDSVEEEAKKIGSVNTIHFKKGRKIGYNTDVYGFMKTAEKAKIKLKDRKVLVLGSGGAGRGIAFKLSIEGANVSLYDTDASRARMLSEDIKEKTGNETITNTNLREGVLWADVLVNATPVGMHPRKDTTPVDKSMLKPQMDVIDIVYNPVKTRLLEDAQSIGCKTAGGVDMLVYQGAKAFQIWFSIEPPVEIMKKAVVSSL
jgi:shikimate dehydrogenase